MKSVMLAIALLLSAVRIVFANAPEDEEARIREIREARLKAGVAVAIRLRNSMKDPDSFHLERATRTEAGAFCYWFRARNSFNAVVPGQAVSVDGATLVRGNALNSYWRKHCNGSGSPAEDYDTIADALNNFIRR